MLWSGGGITFDAKTPLHIMQDTLTANPYIHQIFNPYVLPFLNANPGITFPTLSEQQWITRITIMSTHCLGLQKVPISIPLSIFGMNFTDAWTKRPRQPRTRAEVRQALQEEWNRFPQYRIRRFVASMRRWCRAVIATRGGHTKYWICKLNTHELN